MNIKTELPHKRRKEDGRNESVIVYEYEFDVSETMMMVPTFPPDAEKELKMENEGKREAGSGATGRGKTKTFKADWEDFKPTYRGRPVPPHEAKKVDPAEIKEISIMCRSNVSFCHSFCLPFS